MRPFHRLVDVVAAPTVGLALGVASFARRARVFHPAGAAFQAKIDLAPDAPAVSASALGPPGRHHAVIRLSRGIGLPEGTPDILGLAIRLVDVHGPDRHQDLLVVSSGAAPVARHAILPVGSFGGSFYSSILPYRCATSDGEELILFGARPLWPDGVELHSTPTRHLDDVEREIESGRLRFQLLAASLTRPWQVVGTLDGGRRLGDAEEQSLRFNVFNTGEALQPAGALNAMRRSAYRLSQAARPTPMADPTGTDSAP